MGAVVGAIASRVTYANVVATVALFVALGGASYAVVVLPANSVGPRQLRRGAVGFEALGFPLGVESIVDSSRDTVERTACNAPREGPMPKVTLPPPCRPGPFYRVRDGRVLKVEVSAAGRLFISAVVGLSYIGPPGTSAEATAAILVHRGPEGTHRRPVATADATLQAGQRTSLPVQTVVRVQPGEKTVELGITGSYANVAPGEIVDTPVSLVAIGLPPAPATLVEALG